MPTSRATRVTSSAKDDSWSTIVLMVVFSSRISPRASTSIFFGQVALGDGGGDLGDVADLAGQVVGHRVDVVGEVLPRAGDAGHPGLAAEDALGADLAGHPGDLVGERRQRVDHRVDGVRERGDLALGLDGDLLASGRRWRRRSATWAMLRTWPVRLPAIELTLSVRSFQVPATPRTCAWPPRLPSVPTSRATRVTSSANADSWSTIVLMVVLQLEDLAPGVDGDLLATGRPWRPRW